MRWIIILILLIANTSRADDWLGQVTFDNPEPPGSVILRYGGIEGLVREEAQKQLFNLWIDYNKTLYQSEVIDFDEYRNLNTQAILTASNCDVVGMWWERTWLESLGPPRHPTVYCIGNQSDIINCGFLRVNSKFKFKFEDYKLLDTHPNHNRWELRLRPVLSLGGRSFFQMVELRLVLIYLLREVRLIDIQVGIGYRQQYGFYCGFDITLPQW